MPFAARRVLRWLGLALLTGVALAAFVRAAAELFFRASGTQAFPQIRYAPILVGCLALALVERSVRLVPMLSLPPRFTGWPRQAVACGVSVLLLFSAAALAASLANPWRNEWLAVSLAALLLIGAALAVESAISGSESRSRRVANALGASLLAVVAASVLLEYGAYRERKTLLATTTARVQRDVRAWLAVADKLGEFQARVGLAESHLERLKPILPGVLISLTKNALDTDAELLKKLARGAGLRSIDVSGNSSMTHAFLEVRFELSFEGTRDQVARFVADLAKLQRLARIDDVFLPGRKGTIRVRTFASLEYYGPTTTPTDICAPTGGVPLPWLFSTREEEEGLRRACMRRRELSEIGKKVGAFDAKMRLLREQKAFVDSIRSLPAAPIETEYTRKRLTLGNWQPLRFEAAGQSHVAHVVTGDEKQLSLLAGDRLADGIVQSIARDHLIVAKRVVVARGKQPVVRQLRFAKLASLPPLALGHDTTRITSPLYTKPDFLKGTPDYMSWVDLSYGAGVTRENNAAEPLHAAVKGLIDAGHTFFDELSHEKRSWRPWVQPWSETDCPSCAVKLERNAQPLAAISAAARRTRYFAPAQTRTPTKGYWFPSPLLQMRHAANALAARGMLRLRRGDVPGAAEDALTLERVAALVEEGPQLIQQLIAIALRSTGAPLLRAVAAAPSLTAEEAGTFLHALEALRRPSSFVRSIDVYERADALEQLQFLHLFAERSGPGAMHLWLEPEWMADVGDSLKVDPIVYLIPAEAVDWDEALRALNRAFDADVATLRATSAEEYSRLHAAATKQRETVDRQVRTTLASLKRGVRGPRTAPEIGEAALLLAGSPAGRKQLAQLLVSHESLGRSVIGRNEGEVGSRFDIAAFRLAHERLAKGGYPLSLAETSPPVPGYVLRYGAASAGPAPGTYVMTAVPEQRAVTGHRGFCMDSTGKTRITIDGTAPRIVNGLCDPKAALLR